jgi:hypothetical protein
MIDDFEREPAGYLFFCPSPAAVTSTFSRTVMLRNNLPA